MSDMAAATRGRRAVRFRSDKQFGYDVVGENGTIGSLTEAEAHIIAWALNQVAAGRVIVALVSPDDAPDGPRYAGFYCEDYDGPTEGVAQ